MSPLANNNSGGKTRFRDFTMVSYTYKRGDDGKHMLSTLVLVGELTLAGLAVVWRMGWTEVHVSAFKLYKNNVAVTCDSCLLTNISTFIVF
jgi:hypothetical protein